MRLPPRQSTAEADLMVPFQLVRLVCNDYLQMYSFRLIYSCFSQLSFKLNTSGSENKFIGTSCNAGCN